MNNNLKSVVPFIIAQINAIYYIIITILLSEFQTIQLIQTMKIPQVKNIKNVIAFHQKNISDNIKVL